MTTRPLPILKSSDSIIYGEKLVVLAERNYASASFASILAKKGINDISDSDLSEADRLAISRGIDCWLARLGGDVGLVFESRFHTLESDIDPRKIAMRWGNEFVAPTVEAVEWALSEKYKAMPDKFPSAKWYVEADYSGDGMPSVCVFIPMGAMSFQESTAMLDAFSVARNEPGNRMCSGIVCDQDVGEHGRMMAAIFKEDIDAVMRHIDGGVDVNAVDRFGYAPLHIAALVSNERILHELIVSGADIDKVDSFDRTCLDLIPEKMADRVRVFAETARLKSSHGKSLKRSAAGMASVSDDESAANSARGDSGFLGL